jgi:hypothetical protein
MRRKPTALTLGGFISLHEKLKGGVGKHIDIYCNIVQYSAI